MEVEEPHAGWVAVRAGGVSNIHWKTRSGSVREMGPVDLPSGTRVDAAGVVDEVD